MALKEFNKLAIDNIDDFIYGVAPNPVLTKSGLNIGGGTVYPELNFTLPTMSITAETMPEIVKQYREIIKDAFKRAVELNVPGVIAELELLPPTTYDPLWGIEITKAVVEEMAEFEAKDGLKSSLRITPVDIREDRHSPHMWKGEYWDKLLRTFEGCANVGAEMLSIESIGGKDVHDDAIMFCEADKSLFALTVLGVRDMHKLWSAITRIASYTGSISAGDTACGFANTAMVLAEKNYLPKAFAAVVRVISAVRSLAAFEAGAVGPHKDCGYEGVYIKAITGTPISLEGKSSACAHLSPIGNIASCLADMWSNESVQNIKLLGGMAPTISMEQLAYDCRLLNTAASHGRSSALQLRDWLAESDSRLDPQAYVLRPDVVLDISKVIVSEKQPHLRAKMAALRTIELLRNAIKNDEVIIVEREAIWLDSMESQLTAVEDDVDVFTARMLSGITGGKLDPSKYDL